jgi:predicted transcriptional regulator
MSKRLQVELADDAYEKLAEIAKEQGRPISEVVRRALNVDQYLRQEQAAGSKAVIRSPDGDKEIVIV